MTMNLFERLQSICPTSPNNHKNHNNSHNRNQNHDNNMVDGGIKVDDTVDKGIDQLITQSNPEINCGWDLTTMPWL